MIENSQGFALALPPCWNSTFVAGIFLERTASGAACVLEWPPRLSQLR